MAVSVALARPIDPIIATYIQEIGRIDAEPNGDALIRIQSKSFHLDAVPAVYEQGKNFAKWERTATGPTPGPPPP